MRGEDDTRIYRRDTREVWRQYWRPTTNIFTNNFLLIDCGTGTRRRLARLQLNRGVRLHEIHLEDYKYVMMRSEGRLGGGDGLRFSTFLQVSVTLASVKCASYTLR